METSLRNSISLGKLKKKRNQQSHFLFLSENAIVLFSILKGIKGMYYHVYAERLYAKFTF